MPQNNKAISFGDTSLLRADKSLPKQRVALALTPEERAGGIYILGIPRSGKTTLLVNMMLQDARNGMGFLFIDPHGDAVYDVLSRLPSHRLNDVILLDPKDKTHSFSLNLFECKNAKDTEEVSRVLSSVQQVFSKLFIPEGETAITLETVLLNATILLIYNQGYTLADLALLLEEKEELQKLVNNIDKRRHFNNYRWWLRYIQMKKQDQDKETASTIRRLLIFTTDEYIKHVVAQTKSSLDFRHIIDNKKIVLVKLPRKDKELSRLTGALIIDRLLNAVYTRDDTQKANRPYFALYCDEFQNYATADMAELFTATGKYHLLPTLAHQERHGQLNEKDVVVGATLAAPHKILFTISEADVKTFASTFALESPAGEPIKEQVMERQFVNETVTTWEPPESEAQYPRELQRLTEKKENAILKAAILYTAVFGSIEYFNAYQENSAKTILEKLHSITDFYSLETYSKTGSFVIPKTHTQGWSRQRGGSGNDSMWTEHGSYEYKLDPLSNDLVKAFTPKMTHKEILANRFSDPLGFIRQPPYQDTLATFDTDQAEIDKKVKEYKQQVEAAFYAKWQEETNMKGLQKIRYEMTNETIDDKIKKSRSPTDYYISQEINKQANPYKEKLIAEAKQKRRAALQHARSQRLSSPLIKVPFTLFLGDLEKPIKEGEYDYISLRANPQIETSILFPYNSRKNTELQTTNQGSIYIVSAPDNERRKTIKASREIWQAFDDATRKHRNKITYIRNMSNKDLQEKWINDLQQDSSIFWKWRYFEEGAYWFLLACQELAKQIATFTKEAEDFARDFPAQHMKTTVFPRDTGIDVPAKKFMGYRSTQYNQYGSYPSEPQYEPMYTYKPGKPMFSPLEMEKYMEGELASIPRYRAYGKFPHEVNGEQQIDKVEIIVPNMPPPPPPPEYKSRIDNARDNTRKQYCKLRDDIDDEIYNRQLALLEKPLPLPQESEPKQETEIPPKKTLPQDSEEEIQREEKPQPTKPQAQKKPTPQKTPKNKKEEEKKD